MTLAEKIGLVKDLVTIAGGISICLAAFGLWLQWKSNVLQRTWTLLGELATAEEDEAHREVLFRDFAGRWDVPPRNDLTAKDAEDLYQIAGKPRDKNPALYDRWNAARIHLNGLERVAFAYVHNLVDRDIIAADNYRTMSKSAEYFKPLIERFKTAFGEGHGWQLIPKAVQQMEERKGLSTTTAT